MPRTPARGVGGGVVGVRPDLLVLAPRRVDQPQLLRRVRDAASREGRIRVFAVVTACENGPDVDVVRTAVPEEVVLGDRLAGHDHMAAGEARVRDFSLLLDDAEPREAGLVHPHRYGYEPQASRGSARSRAPTSGTSTTFVARTATGRRRTCSCSSGCSRSGSTSTRTATAGRRRRPSARSCRATSDGRSCSRRRPSDCRSPNCSATAGTRRGS